MKRRTFIKTLSSAVLLGMVDGCAKEQPKAHFLFGACKGLDQAQMMKDAGYDYIEGGAANVMKPELDDEAFKAELAKLKKLPLPIRSCNGFLPGKFHLTGKETNHEDALKYAELICRRADQIGIPFIGFGSGAARNAPEGFPIDKAKEQFVEFCKKLGARIAKYHVRIAIEPLRKEEANYLQTVFECSDIVDRIGCPNIQILADMYHMRCGNETADSIYKASKKILHCHIAEKKGRNAPGTSGESFVDYFTALRKIGYVGGVSCECGWPRRKDETMPQMYVRVLQELKRQSGQA